MTDRVLLIHGIWNAKAWLAPLARRLRSEGFETEVFGYPSVLGGPDIAIPRLIERLRGSGAARGLAGRAWTSPALGRSAGLLQRGFEACGDGPPVGMVAGNIPRGLGRHFARFEGESDGTVSLDETRLPGLADHCVVASSHSGLVLSAEAARQAAHFLREGRFLPA